MNICFFISDVTSCGGTERISFQVANHLHAVGHNVCFISWTKTNENVFFDLDQDIAVLPLSEKFKPYQIFSNLYSLRKLLKSKNIDLLIDVDTVLTPYSIISKAGLSIKHIAWEHFNASINLGVARRDYGRRLAAALADLSIVLTKEDKAQWLSRFRIRKNIVHIYNPVTVACADDIAPIREKKVILAVGRLAEQKGFDLLLTAWAAIDQKIRSSALLRIVGEGERKPELMALAAELNIADEIEFYGKSSDIERLYREAYAYVLSSRYEGFVLTLTEAMASGLPVISFDCPCGPKELLVDEAGILVPFADISALSQEISGLLTDEVRRNNIAHRCLERSRDFSGDAIMKEWEIVIEGLRRGEI